MRKILLTLSVIIILSSSCIKKDEAEIEKPIIELVSPAACDTLYFGQTFTFKMKITDDSGLGNIKMDCHNNFGHHLHGEHDACNMDDPKDPINPYFDEWIFSLPEDEEDYLFETTIHISDTTDFDTGDYHFHIYVTDADGYQSFTTFDVKVMNSK